MYLGLVIAIVVIVKVVVVVAIWWTYLAVMLLMKCTFSLHQIWNVSCVTHRMSMTMNLLIRLNLIAHLTKIHINLIIHLLMLPLVRIFQIWIDFHTLIQELLSIDFLIDFTLVECFSVSWSWIGSTLLNLRTNWLLIILTHYAHFHKVLAVLVMLLVISISVVGVSWSSTLIRIVTTEVPKMIITCLSHCSLNIRIFSRSMLISSLLLWLKSTRTTFNLSIEIMALLIFSLIKLVLIIRWDFIISSHWTMSLLINLPIRILNWVLFQHHLWIIVLPMIFRMEITGILYRRTIPRVFHLIVVVLPSLACLVTLLIWLISSWWIIYTVFILSILFIIRNVFVLTTLSNIAAFDWWFVVVYLYHSSLIVDSWRLLSKDFHLAICGALLVNLLFFILVN